MSFRLIALPTCVVVLVALAGVCINLHAEPDTETKSPIKKVGTIDIDMVETSPIVFKDRLYRFESVRPNYHGNDTDEAYYRFVDVKSGETTSPFGEGHALGSAFVEDGRVYVFGVPGWPARGASSINIFVSQNLEQWEKHEALTLPGWGLYNTSVCRTDDGRYVMAFEVGRPPEVVGERFTARFAESDDLLNWELLPEPAVYTKNKYSACPTIRWSDGWFYMTHLEALGGYRFATNMVRSRDLVEWQQSPRNPVLMFDKRDKQIATDDLSAEQIERVQQADNRNNSDLDFIEFNGKVILNYSWGDQKGTEHLAQAVFNGTQEAFFAYYFPENSQ